MTKFGAADRSSSNKAGVTLMNNQVGYVVAEVMRGKEGVEVTELPSMIRVDGVNKVEFGYEEIAEALGWDDFGNDDFEEIMSTHYGRMVVLDDRVVLFANPEDAAEYIGFDLKAVVAQERTDMYEKDGEQYFVFDSHLHFWDASPANWVKGQEQYAKGWIECFHAYMGLAPAETHWTLEHFQKYSRRRLRAGRLRERPRRPGRLPVDLPQGLVHRRLQRHRAQRGPAGPLPRQAEGQRPLGPA